MDSIQYVVPVEKCANTQYGDYVNPDTTKTPTVTTWSCALCIVWQTSNIYSVPRISRLYLVTGSCSPISHGKSNTSVSILRKCTSKLSSG